ncbi:MAG TPA: hypothetical protein VKA57_12525 [Solirubrobacteraceae bacterium]|nr:hypothetical protein [Solirubrobacteraceae bacterium]
MLAELRLRQGRSEEAERLLAGLDDDRAARALLERAAPGGDDGELLALHGAVALACCEPDAAAAAAERLRDVAGGLARNDLRAEAALLAGRATAARDATPTGPPWRTARCRPGRAAPNRRPGRGAPRPSSR